LYIVPDLVSHERDKMLQLLAIVAWLFLGALGLREYIVQDVSFVQEFVSCDFYCCARLCSRDTVKYLVQDGYITTRSIYRVLPADISILNGYTRPTHTRTTPNQYRNHVAFSLLHPHSPGYFGLDEYKLLPTYANSRSSTRVNTIARSPRHNGYASRRQTIQRQLQPISLQPSCHRSARPS
jgi:hypothetical protein